MLYGIFRAIVILILTKSPGIHELTEFEIFLLLFNLETLIPPYNVKIRSDVVSSTLFPT